MVGWKTSLFFSLLKDFGFRPPLFSGGHWAQRKNLSNLSSRWDELLTKEKQVSGLTAWHVVNWLVGAFGGNRVGVDDLFFVPNRSQGGCWCQSAGLPFLRWCSDGSSKNVKTMMSKVWKFRLGGGLGGVSYSCLGWSFLFLGVEVYHQNWMHGAKKPLEERHW